MILSGSGRYTDPWHPLDKTSVKLREIAAQIPDVTVELREDIDVALGELSARQDVKVLLVNAADPHRNNPEDLVVDQAEVAAAGTGLDAFLGRGGMLYAVHCAAASLSDFPAYRDALGIRWIPGVSFHPDFSEFEVDVTPRGTAHAIFAGQGNFTVADERYTDLEQAPGLEVLAQHTLDGVDHPILAIHRRTERGSLVPSIYDALGHDERSYDSQRRRELVRESLVWLLSHAN